MAVLAADLLVTHPLLLVGPIVAEAVAKLARIARPQDWGRFVKDWLTRWNLGRQANRLVEVITSPNAAAELGRLRQMSAGTARWAVGVTKCSQSRVQKPADNEPIPTSKRISLTSRIALLNGFDRRPDEGLNGQEDESAGGSVPPVKPCDLPCL